ncbi:hypothetical protein [Nocardia sp. XZ_19_385]|uniref:hypothetical protein n=1 Tax=Nocardia sp. XZ_19_385 TaxID=2769488 RepID=UPI0018909EAA|nr:hypothetical protein [Nocardia sp. XZ_19_385]
MTALQISRRFNGPPGSGNGGYVGGLLAEQHPDAAVTVMLRNKPPLETPLQLSDGKLFDGATLIAESRPGAFERDVPQAVPYGTAEAASSSYQANEMFASCFVCGSARTDGLRIEAGPVSEGLVAAPWSPDDTLPIDTPLLWAAMDCPGGWSLDAMFERPALLGSMTATVFDLPAVGEKCVVIGQNHGDQGRKSYASTAIYGSDHRLLGRAEQIWIRLR